MVRRSIKSSACLVRTQSRAVIKADKYLTSHVKSSLLHLETGVGRLSISDLTLLIKGPRSSNVGLPWWSKQDDLQRQDDFDVGEIPRCAPERAQEPSPCQTVFLALRTWPLTRP